MASSNRDVTHELFGESPTIWVFGYCSLLWKHDFRCKSTLIGYIKDYERRFNQGNETFRGKPGHPGRVGNLEEKKGSQVWGVAYEITGREEVAKVLRALYERETAGGGYSTFVATFYPKRHFHTKPQRTAPSSQSPPGEFNSFSFDSAVLSVPQNCCSDGTCKVSLPPQNKCQSVNNVERRRNPSLPTLPPNVFQTISLPQTDPPLEYRKSKDSGSSTHPSVSSSYDKDNSVPLPQQGVPTSNNYKDSAVSTDHECQCPNLAPVQILAYTATPDNEQYMGSDSLASMAHQIARTSGSAGSNVEYITRTADFLRRHIPEEEDPMLFALDAKVREEVYRMHRAAGTPVSSLAEFRSERETLDHEVRVTGRVYAS